MSDDAPPKRPDVASMVPRTHSTSVNTSDMVKMFQDLAAPWAEAETAKHVEETKRQIEATKRREIDASVQRVAVMVVGAVLGGVLILAGIALVKGNPALAEKVIIALIAATGGFFAGRNSAEKKKPGDD